MNYVGKRVDVFGEKGRVMYYGRVANKTGMFFGIDWENSERGKHNGTLNGIQYFIASTETSGSFVMPQKVSFGRDFMTLLVERYTIDVDPDFGLSSNIYCNRDVEFVKRDKVVNYTRAFEKLVSIFLSNSDVKYFNSDPVIFSNCFTLTLSRTLLESWAVLAKITALFPKLHSLDISCNNFEPLSSVKELEECKHVPKIKTLYADECSLDNESVRRIFVIFPYLTELHIAKNIFNKLVITEGFENLEKLHLYHNGIHDFADISALSQLPRYCRLKNIAFESGFPSLKILVADGNEFSKWEDISDLKKFPKLNKLTLKCLIPGECGVDTREMLISKLENLIELDHCDISVLERKNAERQFLLRIGIMRPIAQVHYWDFERLSEKHHFSYEDAIIAKEDDDYIWIRFKYLTSWLEKQFPRSMELIRATTLVCRLIGGNPREMTYYIRSNNGVDEPTDIIVKPGTLLSDLVFGPDNLLLMKDRLKGALHVQTFE